jgi:type IV pilus assembly protein PilW
MCFRKYRYRGVTLIELLISLSISFFILDALFSLYISCKKNFTLQMHLTAIQEHAQTALQTLKTDIESAGFIGCARLSADFPMQNHTSYVFNPGNKLIVTAHNVCVRHMDIRGNTLGQPMHDFITLRITGPRKYSAKQIMLISDCQSADIFTIQSAYKLDKNLQLITASTPLSKNYDTDAQVAPLLINTYFVKSTGRTSPSGQPISALYMKNINAHTVEMVENISALNLNYSPQGTAIHLEAMSGSLSKGWYTYAPS